MKKKPPKLTDKQQEQYDFIRLFVPRLSHAQFLNYWTAVRQSRRKARRINLKQGNYAVPEMSLGVGHLGTSRDFYKALREAQRTARASEKQLLENNIEYQKNFFEKNLMFFIDGFTGEEKEKIIRYIDNMDAKTWLDFVYDDFNTDMLPLIQHYDKDYVNEANINADRIKRVFKNVGIDLDEVLKAQ